MAAFSRLLPSGGWIQGSDTSASSRLTPNGGWLQVKAAAGGGQTIAVPAGALTLTGYAPTVSTPRTVAVPAGALTLTGFAPTVSTPVTVAVPAGALTLTGYAPNVTTGGTIVQVPAGALTLTGFAPTVSASAIIAVPAGSLTLTGYAPTVTTGEVVVSGQQPAGKARKRRRKYKVEIDGETFDVGSEAEAIEVIEKAREEAQKVAELAISRATAAKGRPARKILADARKALVTPEIKAPGLEDFVASILGQVRQTYDSALQTIEIAALLRKREREDEDDEDILLMLL